MKEIVIFCQYFVVGKAFFHLTYKKGFSNGQGINVPLFLIRTQQFPCSLKVILRYPFFPKSKWSYSLVPKNPWEALIFKSIVFSAMPHFRRDWPLFVQVLFQYIVRVVTKRRNDLQPAKTTYNHLEKFNNHLQPPQKHLQPPTNNRIPS